jgi:hypothetical protein
MAIGTVMVWSFVGWWTKDMAPAPANAVLAIAFSILSGLAALAHQFGSFPLTVSSLLTTTLPLEFISPRPKAWPYGYTEWEFVWKFLPVFVVYSLVRFAIGFLIVRWALRLWDRYSIAGRIRRQAVILAVPVGLMAFSLVAEFHKVWSSSFGEYYDGPLHSFYLTLYGLMLLGSIAVLALLAWRAQHVSPVAPHWTKVVVFGYICTYVTLAHTVLFPLVPFP